MYPIEAPPQVLSKRAWVAKAILAAISGALEVVFELTLDLGLGPIFNGIEQDLKKAKLESKRDNILLVKEELNIISENTDWVGRHIQVARYLKNQFKAMQGNLENTSRPDLLKWFSSNAVVAGAEGKEKFSDLQYIGFYNEKKEWQEGPFVVLYADAISKFVSFEDYFKSVNNLNKKAGLISKRAALPALGAIAIAIVEVVIFYVITELALRGLSAFVSGQLDPTPENIAKAIVNDSKTDEELEEKKAQFQYSLEDKVNMFIVLNRDIFNLRATMFSKTAASGAFSNNFFDLTDYPFDMSVWNGFLKKVNQLSGSVDEPTFNYFINGIKVKMMKYERMHAKIRKKLRGFFMELGPKTGPNLTAHSNAVVFFDDGGSKLYLDIEKLPQSEKNALRADFGNLHNVLIDLLDVLEVFSKILIQTVSSARLFSKEVMKELYTATAGKQVSKEGTDFQVFESLRDKPKQKSKKLMQGWPELPERFKESAGLEKNMDQMVEAFTYLEDKLTMLHRNLVSVSGQDNPLYDRN